MKEKSKTRKERKKQSEESMSKEWEIKRKIEEQGLYSSLPVVSTADIISKSRLEQSLVLALPSTSENTVDAVSGRYKKGAHRNGLDFTEKKDNNLEAVNNEIHEGELSAKFHPILHTSENSEHMKPDMEEAMNNKIHLFHITEDTTLVGINSASEYDKAFEAAISEERKGEREKVISKTPLLAPNTSVTPEFTDADCRPQNDTKQDAKMEGQSHRESDSPAESGVGNTTEKGDLSCLSGVFLPAPHVANAEVKYTR
jgi:hypothetical protein